MQTIICLFCIFFLLIFPIFTHSQNVKEILSTLPQEEKEELNRLFYSMMRDDHLAYTLFGDKPVSLSGNFIITPLQNIQCGMVCGSVFWKRWQIWEKYAHHFPLNKYVFIQERHPYRHVGSVYLINKKLFIQQVNRHLDIFENVLGVGITGEILLKQIEQQGKFSACIQDNKFLLGILLGYGKHNAELFARRERLFLFVLDQDIPNQQRLPQLPFKEPLPSKGFSSIKEEYQFLKTHLQFFGDYDYSPLILQPVHFVADPDHEETKKLKQKYQALRHRISAIYAQGDFLEMTLNQLISH